MSIHRPIIHNDGSDTKKSLCESLRAPHHEAISNMSEENRRLLILVAGPYRSNTGDDPEKIANNLQVMTAASLQLFRLGHIPVTGEALALPLIEVAGSKQIGDEIFNEIFHPMAGRLVERVDAVLRIGGPSTGADEMVALARAAGKQVYTAIDEIERR
jgi:hypothetical protein